MENPAAPSGKTSLFSMIPEELREKYRGGVVLEVGFGAGPSCVAGEIKVFREPTDFGTALAWLETRRGVFRRAHLLLADRTVLWFDPSAFRRHDNAVHRDPPRPGIGIETAKAPAAGRRRRRSPSPLRACFERTTSLSD